MEIYPSFLYFVTIVGAGVRFRERGVRVQREERELRGEEGRGQTRSGTTIWSLFIIHCSYKKRNNS